MIHPRRSSERGHANHGWLDTYHSFSFADYQNPDYMGFRKLRVINEDWVEPGQGFGTHAHHDMEIITYVLEGSLEHKDSIGNGSVISPGDVQRMSAGTGVTHSEFNHSKDKKVHLLQIWIFPEKSGLPPSYEQKRFNAEEKTDQLRLIASNNPMNGVVRIHQNVSLYASILTQGKELTHSLKNRRHGWLQVVRGAVKMNEISMNQGDGAAVSDENILKINALAVSEILLFDLA